MENQTRFDLNAAVENWRQELTVQPPLTPDNRRELETHLRDALAELKARGLNDEESFWLARRRVGQPQKLAEEFARANPSSIWKARLFWFACGLLIVRLWSCFTWCLSSPVYFGASYSHRSRFEDLLPQWMLFYLPHWVRDSDYSQAIMVILPLVNLTVLAIAVIFIAKGGLQRFQHLGWFVFKSRSRFISLVSLLLLFFFGVGYLIWNLLIPSNATARVFLSFSLLKPLACFG